VEARIYDVTHTEGQAVTVYPLNLLMMTKRKLHTRYRLVSKLVTLDDLERPFRTLFQNTCVIGAHHENLNEDRPILSATKM